MHVTAPAALPRPASAANRTCFWARRIVRSGSPRCGGRPAEMDLSDINEAICESREIAVRPGRQIEVLIMTVRLASAWLVVFCVAGGSVRAQDAGTDDVQQGHRLATLICSACHVAAPDQP